MSAPYRRRTEWAHDTDRSGPNRDVPVVTISSDPLDRCGWHEASAEEIEQYEAYWNGRVF